jgi:hypothetical protein
LLLARQGRQLSRWPGRAAQAVGEVGHCCHGCRDRRCLLLLLRVLEGLLHKQRRRARRRGAGSMRLLVLHLLLLRLLLEAPSHRGHRDCNLLRCHLLLPLI